VSHDGSFSVGHTADLRDQFAFQNCYQLVFVWTGYILRLGHLGISRPYPWCFATHSCGELRRRGSLGILND
jgi:hypothetical protein